MPVIDIDRFVYTKQSEENGSNSAASVSQFTASYEASAFLQGKGQRDFTAAKNKLDQILSNKNVDAKELEEAEETFFRTLFELRKPVQ